MLLSTLQLSQSGRNIMQAGTYMCHCVPVGHGTPPPWLNTIDADKINRAGGGRLLPGCLVWAHPRHISLGSG